MLCNLGGGKGYGSMPVFGFGYGGRFPSFAYGVTKLWIPASEAYT